MNAISDELKHYDSKQIYDIKNVDFENGFTLNNKYYLFVKFYDNCYNLIAYL